MTDDLIKEAREIFPYAQNDALALGKYSMHIFEKLINIKPEDKNFIEYRDKYFEVREAYEYEFRRMINCNAGFEVIR